MLMEDADIVDSFGMVVDSGTFWLLVGNAEVIVDAERCDVVPLVGIEDDRIALSLRLIDVKSS